MQAADVSSRNVNILDVIQRKVKLRMNFLLRRIVGPDIVFGDTCLFSLMKGLYDGRIPAGTRVTRPEPLMRGPVLVHFRGRSH